MKKFYSIIAFVAMGIVADAQIVINEVYGGGGNSGSTYKNDFVELINKGTTPVTLNGAYLQYGSAANAMSQYHALPNITLNPGQTYLIQEAAGNGGTTNLPTPDYVAPAPSNFGTGTNTTPGFAMGSGSFKVALTTNNTAITSSTDSNVIDMVGAGSTASFYEGSAPAPAPSNSLAITRTNGVDTNNNAADFVTAAPSPTPSSSSTLATAEIKADNTQVLVKNTSAKSNVTFGVKANDVKFYNMGGQVVKTLSVKADEAVNVEDLQPGMYIVTATVNGQPVSQKILKK